MVERTEEDSAPPSSGDEPSSDPLGPGRYDRSLSGDERRAEQRERLILAATRVFAQHGFAKSNVALICEGARMSRRTFYEHFADLSEAFLAVYEFASDSLYKLVAQRVESAERPEEKVRAGIEAFLVRYVEFGDLSRVLAREIAAAGPEHGRRHQQRVTRFAQLISDGVEAAHAEGLAGRRPDEVTVHALLTGIEAVAIRYLDNGQPERAREALDPLVELVLRAFR